MTRKSTAVPFKDKFSHAMLVNDAMASSVGILLFQKRFYFSTLVRQVLNEGIELS